MSLSLLEDNKELKSLVPPKKKKKEEKQTFVLAALFFLFLTLFPYNIQIYD